MAWDCDDWTVRFDYATDENVQPWTLAFNDDGTYLATSDWSRGVDVRCALSGTRIARITGHGGLVTHLCFRPGDPNLLATADADGILRLWDVAAGQSVLRLDPFDGWDANCIGFSPDGRRMFSASANGVVMVWDLAYYDRHIAGSLEYELERWSPALGDRIDHAGLAAWRAKQFQPRLRDPAHARTGWPRPAL